MNEHCYLCFVKLSVKQRYRGKNNNSVNSYDNNNKKNGADNKSNYNFQKIAVTNSKKNLVKNFYRKKRKGGG